MKRARRLIAEKVWNLASWINADFDRKQLDEQNMRFWNASMVWESTEAEADKVFDRLVEMTCTEPGHHPLAPCGFCVASFGPAADDETGPSSEKLAEENHGL